MKIKFLALNILIPVLFVMAVYSSFLCIGSIKKHEHLLQYKPARTARLQEVDELKQNRQDLLRSVPAEEVSIDLLVEVALLNEDLDQIMSSESFQADLDSYSDLLQSFAELENKLTVRYILQALGVVFGFVLAFWLTKVLHSRYEADVQ